MCSVDRHCWQWAMKHMEYCICSSKDDVSLILGSVSVISWGVADVPQIITNYRAKSTEGLSFGFLMTWIIGDLFNLLGCMLESATLPTQYYMALLYTIVTVILIGQAVYYGHIYPRLKQKSQEYKNLNPSLNESFQKDVIKMSASKMKPETTANIWMNGSDASDKRPNLTSPIPLPAIPTNASSGRGLYFVSARSLSSSHTPPGGSFFTRGMSPATFNEQISIEEPLLSGSSLQSAPSPNRKNILCLASSVTFLGTISLPHSLKDRIKEKYGKPSAVVMRIGRKLLQVNADFSGETGSIGNARIGTFLGWSMAVIYMGGRLPQICLNGLNPLMFMFALVGNFTYVASLQGILGKAYSIRKQFCDITVEIDYEVVATVLGLG
ncbi:hypothetical protein SAY87_030446 [Trapa incisa]|uniref:PQ-loop repeat family protein / transmembrane family protein n=1 Tax=Trapa incisa TaxID=236973 RepID=A0AAN7KP11_9MYRT|nr:hypothetical protein SAY87_030446 [Trapa incisa]